MRSELVSVVVPAYNAESTLRATLASVRAQTYRRLEIIVVDDGSTDGTGGLVREAAALDGRIRLLSIDNSGVAAARNAGIAASRGAYVAPVDADDLWHPEKIARQVDAIEAGGPGVGYVYTLFRRIDAEDRVIHDGPPWDISGAVFLRLLLYNFVGNGSSLLIRRAAIEGAGGYEPDLRIQGSEDYLAQIVLARRWKVALVPEYLTGYRQSASSMSRNRVRMEQSTLLMIERIRQRFPEAPEELLAAAEATIRARLAVTHLVNRRRAVQAAKEFARALRSAPRGGPGRRGPRAPQTVSAA
jgi:glycosyltransferase involved in cell wall biosynthesis